MQRQPCTRCQRSAPRHGCMFCKYYQSKHSYQNCPCVSCWQRRQTAALPNEKTPSPPPSQTTASLSCSSSAPPAPQHLTCVHYRNPYHHCRDCVLPPYISAAGKTIEQRTAPRCCCCGGLYESPQVPPPSSISSSSPCQSGRQRPNLNRPKFFAYELPEMGPKAILYTASS